MRKRERPLGSSGASVRTATVSAVDKDDPGPRYEFSWKDGEGAPFKVTAYGPSPSLITETQYNTLMRALDGDFHPLVPGVWLHRLLADPCTYHTNMGLWAARQLRTEADKIEHSRALRERRALDVEDRKAKGLSV